MRKKLVASALVLGIAYAGHLQAEALTPAARQAQKEYDMALTLTPDLDNGKMVYLTCAVCHRPEGWGSPDGIYPQIAGQLSTVIIKQLADIRSRNRDNPIMYPFAVPRIMGGAQEMADVAAYIAKLPMSPINGVGSGRDLARGEKLYKDNCVDCHGANGEGDSKDHIPAIWGQHYLYLVRQFEWIKLGKRRNADMEMQKQIRNFSGRDIHALMDYVSRLKPADERVAKDANWHNPDFPNYVRPSTLRH